MTNLASYGRPLARRHRVLVVGGLIRLEPFYRCCASNDVTIEVANANSSRLSSSVTHADAVLVIVPNVSHAAVLSVRRQARRLGLPVAHATSAGAKHVSERIQELVQANR